MPTELPAGDPGPRPLTDPKVMRALAHPVRLALVELLTIDGAHTATQAAHKIGESPSNCSFHLRQLAKYGFVQETGDGTGRQRPWRMRAVGYTIHAAGQDTETSIAAQVLSGMFEERVLERLHRWRAERAMYPQVWQDAAGWYESVWWLTPSELEQLNEQLRDIAMTYRDRLIDPASRPEGAEPIEMFAVTFPVRPPAAPATPGAGARASV